MHPRRHPPTVLEAIVAALLPPSRREQVMGDLAERHADPSHINWGPELRYLMDAATVVPPVFWHHLRRTHRAQPITAGLVAPQADQLRRRVEEFQDELWRRHWLFGIGIAVLVFEIPLFVRTLGFMSLILLPPIIDLPRRWWNQPAGRSIPKDVEPGELLQIHRDALNHQGNDLGLVMIAPSLQILWARNIFTQSDRGSVGWLHLPATTWEFALLTLAVALLASIWMAILRIRLLSEISALNAISLRSSE